ncbi:hypothetical protein CDB3_07440 [Bacillus sp. CDB3]|nr:hypothetical protein CDB3_07440 [Bacillus sp. CDB3]
MKKSIIASFSLMMTLTCMGSYSYAEEKNTPEYTGKGVKVAIIDTGIDSKHPDLQKNYIGGYDFVDNVKNPEDDGGHGTAVAGIIAANGKMKGVAPDASLLVYRAYGTEKITKAIDRAVIDGANIINISMGVTYNGSDTPLNQAIQRAIAKNVTVVTAAGNEGPNPWTIASLASTPEAITVGNLKKRGISQTLLQVSGEQQEIQFNFPGLQEPNPPKPGKYQVVHIPTLTLDSIQKQRDLKNKILLIEDGDNIEEYFQELKKRGVVALLVDIRNDNQVQKDSTFHNKETDQMNKLSIPIGIIWDKKEKQILEKAAKEQKLITIFQDSKERIVNHSSNGPALGSWQIKPDIVAPGEGTETTSPLDLSGPPLTPKKGYEIFGGTSAAAPHVAGAAALLKQAHPEWSPVEIRAALTSTAQLIHDHTDQMVTPLAQGSGQIDINKALQANILPLTNNLSFGFLKSHDGVQTITRYLKIKNVSNRSQTFTMKNQLLEGNAEIQMPSSITIPAHDTVEIPVTLKVDTSLSISKHIGMISLTKNKDQINIPYIALVEPKDYPFVSIDVSNHGSSHIFEYYTPFPAEQLTISITGHTADNKPISSILMKKNNPSQGYQQFQWNGMDKEGKKVPKGTYTVTIVAKYNNQSYEQSIPPFKFKIN